MILFQEGEKIVNFAWRPGLECAVKDNDILYISKMLKFIGK